MEHFDFQRVYEEFARPFDNRSVPTNPFGPVLVKSVLEDEGVFIVGMLTPAVMLPFFMSDDGAEYLQQLIDNMLSTQADNFCIVKTHECHVKMVDTEDQTVLEAMKEKRLTYDPSAQNCIAMMIYHKTGVRAGCLPIDQQRVSHYAPMLPKGTEFSNVKTDANPLH